MSDKRRQRTPKPLKRRGGFNEFSRVLRDEPYKARSVARCESCVFFSDKKECQNNNVTEFDIYRDGDVVVCSFWKGVEYDNGRKKKEDDWGW